MNNFFSDSKVMRVIEEKYGAFYDKKQVLFSEGERADKFYILREGGVKIVKSFQGQHTTINIVKPNELFGELGILSYGKKRSASAITIKESFIVTLNKEILYKFMETNKKFVLIILKELANKIRNLSLMVRDLSTGRDLHIVNSHLANYININYEDEMYIKGSIEEVAYYISRESGITKKDVIEVFHKLRDEKVLSIDDEKNLIIDNKKNFIQSIYHYF